MFPVFITSTGNCLAAAAVAASVVLQSSACALLSAGVARTLMVLQAMYDTQNAHHTQMWEMV
jgi:hypothetical protein